MPTLLLGGANDRYSDVAAKEFSAVLPNARVRMLPCAGHLSSMEVPELFNATLIEFLRDVDGTAVAD